MLIRAIETKDAKDFLEMSKDIDKSGFMLYEPNERQITLEQQIASIERIISEKNSIIFVAEIDNKLVGFIAAFGGKLKRNKHSAYLISGVVEEFQGRGIATKLFNRVYKWAKENEILRLELTVIKNNIKALNLYKKQGFIIEGEKVHSLIINGIPVNEYSLYKILL